MGQAKLYGQISPGMSINGIVESCYAYKGEDIKAGDLVEYINGVAGQGEVKFPNTLIEGTDAYSGMVISATAIDTNKVLVLHSKTSEYHLYGVIVTIEGAAFKIGVDTALGTSTYTGKVISAVTLENNKVFVAHSTSSSNYYMAIGIITISGDVITLSHGTAYSTKNAGAHISVSRLSDKRVLIAHSYGSYKYAYCTVCTISGTTITKGSDYKINNSASNCGTVISCAGFGSYSGFVAHNYSGDNYTLYGCYCDISGTTITVGTDTKLSSDSNSARIIKVLQISNIRVLILHSYGLSSASLYSDLYGMMCQATSSSMSLGTDTLVDSYLTTTGLTAELLPLSGTQFHERVAVVYSSLSSSIDAIALLLDYSVITKGSSLGASIVGNDYGKQAISTTILEDETICTFYSNPNTYLSGRCNCVKHYDSSAFIRAEFIVDIYETQVRKTTTSEFDGIAKTSGKGGDDTGHNSQVKIYTKKETYLPLSVYSDELLNSEITYDSVSEPVTFNSTGYAHYSSPCLLKNGNIFIAYRDHGNSDYGTFVIVDKNYNIIKQPTVFRSSDCIHIATYLLDNGNVIIAYRDYGASSGIYGYFEIYDQDGNLVKGATSFVTATNIAWLSFCRLTNSNILLTFTAGSSYYGYYTVIDQSGNIVKSSTIISTDYNCSYSSPCLLQDGTVVVVGLHDDGGIVRGVVYAKLSETAMEVTKNFTMLYSTAKCYEADACTLNNGNIFFVYRDSDNSVGRVLIFTPDGTIVKHALYKNNVADLPEVCLLENGNVLVCYRDANSSFAIGITIFTEAGVEVGINGITGGILISSDINGIHPDCCLTHNKTVFITYGSSSANLGRFVIFGENNTAYHRDYTVTGIDTNKGRIVSVTNTDIEVPSTIISNSINELPFEDIINIGDKLHIINDGQKWNLFEFE